MNSFFSLLPSGDVMFRWWNGAGWTMIAVDESIGEDDLTGDDENEILFALERAGATEIASFEYGNGGSVLVTDPTQPNIFDSARGATR